MENLLVEKNPAENLAVENNAADNPIAENFVNTGDVLLEVKNVKKYYPIHKGFMRKKIGEVKAVDDVSLYINRNETLGLVGESGCGKTTLGRCVMRAIEPTEGDVLLHLNKGEEPINITKLDKAQLREIRRHMAIIFQNPYSSLNPRMTVLDIVSEPLNLSGYPKDQIVDRVSELVEMVGLQKRFLNRYPHAFSGGQRQRIGIARALALNPKLVVADEAVSALDVSIQAQILNLLSDLKESMQPTFLFIAHDLSVIEHVSDRVGVMYVGRLVELAPTEEIYLAPRHPYTEALLSAIPRPEPGAAKNRILLPGEVANAANLPAGCCFHPRCRYAKPQCSQEVPVLEEISFGHYVACHRAKELNLRGINDIGASV